MQKVKEKFIAGKTYIPVSGKVFDNEEINNATEAAKDCWWTEGRWAKQFEKEFGKFLGVKHVSLVNSGSSANLVAVAALTSKVFGERRLKSGDEYITTPAAFPTTINPGIQYGLKPVFIDSKVENLNIDVLKIEKAITKKTKLIMIAHTLGIPFNLDEVVHLAKKYNLWLIEDCCDALGTRYNNKLVGTFGDIATYSFYPAHHITMGEGGAAVTSNPLIHKSIRQFRDWGRDCWCDTGKDNSCKNRFNWKIGELPKGYDHKYTYTQIGFNLKLTDFQAAIGVAQLKKLPHFIKKRKQNYQTIYQIFRKYQKFLILMKTEKKENPCWFGFPIILSKNAPFTRNQFTEYLEENKIGTRNVFAGNLLKHPAYKDIKYKKVGRIVNADTILNYGFWIGLWPGINHMMLDYIKKTVDKFFSQHQ